MTADADRGPPSGCGAEPSHGSAFAERHAGYTHDRKEPSANK
jgi:hypothetical protein